VDLGKSTEQLTSVNMFFGMSESEDSAIIFSKFRDPIIGEMQNLLKTQVVSLSTFLTELRKSQRAK
jgi:hypothetical protein